MSEDFEKCPAVADAILREARTWIGTPYRHQAGLKGIGCDCLGLVRGIWLAVYGEEAERPAAYSADWAEAGNCDPLFLAARRHCREKSVADLRAGDLILFRWRPHLAAKHAGILAGPAHFVHAYEGHAVVVSALVPQWRKRIAGVFAFPERSELNR